MHAGGVSGGGGGYGKKDPFEVSQMLFQSLKNFRIIRAENQFCYYRKCTRLVGSA